MWWFAIARAEPAPDVLLDALTTELDRTMSAWEGQPDAPYFLSYRVTDQTGWTVSARYGALAGSSTDRTRSLDVSARVGSPARDSTHALKGDFGSDTNFHLAEQLPLDGSREALRTSIWIATNKELSDARERWLHVKANQTVKVADDDPSADFSVEAPVVDLGAAADLVIDPAAWEPLLVELSAMLDRSPDVHQSHANLHATRSTEYIVSSEGTRVRQGREWVRIALDASTTLDDGMEIQLYRWKDVTDPSELPDAATLRTWANELERDLLEMKAAPPGEPYSGPVLLTGRAAGVFVHEVLGHRTEGHRQKDDDEGQTFTDKVGDRILPATISVVDDPTVATWAGEMLNGHYRFDQEGVPAQKAVLVEKGVFRGFLMSRSPIAGFEHSNGHGRAQARQQPVARMANTILETTEPLPVDVLRKRMRAELVAQGRSYGLLVDEIGGGFTLTGRVMPNAFNVRAITAWKIFADGRPDERVRGVDLVGTPLAALSNVIGVGDDPAVFNGFCGAESGMVPNSAVSPSLLLRSLEVQKKEKDTDRPPLLPKPATGGES